MKLLTMITAVAAVLAPVASHAATGLTGRYYANGYGMGPTGSAGTPTATFNTNTVCFPDCNSSINDGEALSSLLGVSKGYTTGLSTDFNGLQNHALFLDGFLRVATAGTYNIGTYSDDGSYLYLDDKLVVNNGSDHGPQFVSADVVLTAGLHKLGIYQEERGGGTSLTAYFNNSVMSGDLLTTNAVPEPAAWAMLLGGFGLVGAAVRRRRRSTLVTA